MVQCGQCSAALPDVARFCLYCGALLTRLTRRLTSAPTPIDRRGAGASVKLSERLAIIDVPKVVSVAEATQRPSIPHSPGVPFAQAIKAAEYLDTRRELPRWELQPLTEVVGIFRILGCPADTSYGASRSPGIYRVIWKGDVVAQTHDFTKLFTLVTGNARWVWSYNWVIVPVTWGNILDEGKTVDYAASYPPGAGIDSPSSG